MLRLPPPVGNVSAPINIGSLLQEKTGSLQLDGSLGVIGQSILMGSVGIGNLNPQAKLDIQGTSTTNSYSAQADQADLRILSANNRPYDGAILELGGAWGATGYIKTEALNGTAGAMTLGVRQSTSNPAMNPLMTLDMSGNVGINNTNPAATLDVNGSVKLEGAGTPGAGKVLTSDAAGNATWQMSGVKSNGPVYQSSQAVISDHGCVNFNHNLRFQQYKTLWMESCNGAKYKRFCLLLLTKSC